MVDILSMRSPVPIFLSRGKKGRILLSAMWVVFMALDPQALQGDRDFEGLDDLTDIMRATPPVEDGKPVLIAGDPEWEAFEARSSDGACLCRSS